jgi:hypothetical protein
MSNAWTYLLAKYTNIPRNKEITVMTRNTDCRLNRLNKTENTTPHANIDTRRAKPMATTKTTKTAKGTGSDMSFLRAPLC